MREGLAAPLSQPPGEEVVDATVAVADVTMKRSASTTKKAKSSKSVDGQSRASKKSKKSKKKKPKASASQMQQKKADIDAARHLRLVVQSIKEDQTLGASDKRETIDRFNALLKKVEADNRKASRKQSGSKSISGSKSSSFIVEYPTKPAQSKPAHSTGRMENEAEARNDTEDGRLSPSSNAESSGGRDETSGGEYCDGEDAPEQTVVQKEPTTKQKPSKNPTKSTKKPAPSKKSGQSKRNDQSKRASSRPNGKTRKSTGQKPKRKPGLMSRLFGKPKKSTKTAKSKEPSRTARSVVRTAEPEEAEPSSTFEPKMVDAEQDFADDDDDQTQADSIMDLREANSDHYAESICSVRSLNTFEKDFIKAIVNVNNQEEDDSVHTFEEDMQKKLLAPPPRPQEVVFDDGHAMQDDFDDLTVEGIDSGDSETTFERDARERTAKSWGFTAPPTAPPKPSEFFMPKQHEVENASECSFRSETTYEKDQRLSRERQAKLRPSSSAEPTFRDFQQVFKKVSNIGPNKNVSLNQKDHRALIALAKKIGRVPSTRSRASYDGSSVGPKSPASARSPGNLFVAGAGKPLSAVHETTDRPRTPVAMKKKEEEKDEPTVFEKDLMTQNLNGPGVQHHTPVNAGSFGSKSAARGEAVQALPPKITPLAVELSPDAVGKGMKKLEQGTLWDKLWTGGWEW